MVRYAWTVEVHSATKLEGYSLKMISCAWIVSHVLRVRYQYTKANQVPDKGHMPTWKVRYSLALLKGGRPVSIWYTMQPSAHRSTE